MTESSKFIKKLKGYQLLLRLTWLVMITVLLFQIWRFLQVMSWSSGLYLLLSLIMLIVNWRLLAFVKLAISKYRQ